MSARIQSILDASSRLNALQKRIDETYPFRDRGAEERERWSQACAEFHRGYGELFYPGGDDSLHRLKALEPEAVASALDFLEADPRHFGSGYTKEKVWRRLRRAPLDSCDGARLEQIALAYLTRQTGREFWLMARVMSTRGSTDFWRAVAELESSAEEPRKTRASYLLLYREGPRAGEEFRKKLRMDRLMEKYGRR